MPHTMQQVPTTGTKTLEIVSLLFMDSQFQKTLRSVYNHSMKKELLKYSAKCGTKPNVVTLVRNILELLPETRDDNGLLNTTFFESYLAEWTSLLQFIRSNVQGSIERASRLLQNKFPELRWEKWIDRQKNAQTFRVKFRNQEMPEELI